MLESPIGIIDSGLGGLSIWKSIRAILPHESLLYIGDHGNLPYSKKETEFIRDRVICLIRFLLQKKAKMVVVACNTATVAGIDYYRKIYPQIPIIGVVPVIKTAAQLSKKKSFAVLSTTFTSESDYQKELIQAFARDCTVYNLGCPNLVSFVEKGKISGIEIEHELRMLLDPVKEDIDVIALGCTHYPFLEDQIRGIVGKNVQILDSGGAVARQVERILEHNKSLAKTKNPLDAFFTTGDEEKVTSVATKLLGKLIEVRYAAV